MKQNVTALLEELEALAQKLHVVIVYEKIRSIHPRMGGLCRIKGEYRLYIEKKSSISERVALLLESLSLFDLEDIFIAPKTRELLLAKQVENQGRHRVLPGATP
ncbi:hypothetical protein KKF84_01235 [Myxococcota bacterium]|nr:hypothetical protein [Myxococcota bacterium]MBU1533907.1 hypothetical protein [Myxococcota bacterium]